MVNILKSAKGLLLVAIIIHVEEQTTDNTKTVITNHTFSVLECQTN